MGLAGDTYYNNICECAKGTGFSGRAATAAAAAAISCMRVLEPTQTEKEERRRETIRSEYTFSTIFLTAAH